MRFLLKRVIASYGFEALCEDPETGARQMLKHRRSMRPVCGDWICVQGDTISEIRPRKNVIERLKNKRVRPPIAANVDRLGIVISSAPSTPWFFVDAWLLAAWMQNITPILIKNKSDISAFEPFSQACNERFSQCGYEQWTGNIFSSEDIEKLLSALKEKTVLMVGLSGVGKSSLTNALIPNTHIKTQPLSNYSLEGQHTTTSVTLHHFAGDLKGGIIDSPGIKEIDIAIPEHMEAAWPEFEPYLGHCQYRNCQHEKESGCAILAGVADGFIHKSRYDGFCHIKKTLGLKNPWE